MSDINACTCNCCCTSSY